MSLAFRTMLSGNPTVRELLACVRASTLCAYANQEVPVEKIVEVLRPKRSPDRWSLFQVEFQYRNLPKLDWTEFEDLRFEPFEFNPSALGGLDLSLDIEDAERGLRCSFRYDPSRLSASAVKGMTRGFQNLLEAIVRDPDQRVRNLPILTAG